MYVSMYVLTYIYTETYTHISTRICMYVHICTHIHVYTRIKRALRAHRLMKLYYRIKTRNLITGCDYGITYMTGLYDGIILQARIANLYKGIM